MAGEMGNWDLSGNQAYSKFQESFLETGPGISSILICKGRCKLFKNYSNGFSLTVKTNDSRQLSTVQITFCLETTG